MVVERVGLEEVAVFDQEVDGAFGDLARLHGIRGSSSWGVASAVDGDDFGPEGGDPGLVRRHPRYDVDDGAVLA